LASQLVRLHLGFVIQQRLEHFNALAIELDSLFVALRAVGDASKALELQPVPLVFAVHVGVSFIAPVARSMRRR